jgi:CubicO group peptidase (beta-lactamase class C family)
MVAHLNIPSLDTTKNLASTLSPKVVNDLLKTEMGFKGLIFTDALNMKGVANYYSPGVVDVKALLAGNDVLLFAEDVPKAIEEIKKAIGNNEIMQEEIDERCKKILKAKYWCGLNHKPHIQVKNLYEDLNTDRSNVLNSKLAEATITLLKNDNLFLPLKGLDTFKIAEVSLGLKDKNTFYNSVSNYAPVSHFGLEHDASKKEVDSLFARLKNYNLILLQVNKANLKPQTNYGISDQSLRIVDSLSQTKTVVATFFANPYLLNALKTPSKLTAVIMAYEYTTFSQRAAADAIFGAIKVNGKLPVSTKYFKYNTGLEIKNTTRIQFVSPEDLGLQKKNLERIDSIAKWGISEKAYPGCQVVAIKDGKLFYQKSFGNYTYDKDATPVSNSTIYDLASITKIAASSLSLMRLNAEGKLDYRKTLVEYLPELSGSNKQDLTIEEVLSHQAGLKAWIPFYLHTIDKQGNYKPGIYNEIKTENYPIQVARKLYVNRGYPDTIYNKIIHSKLENRGKYLYSDLGYYFMQKIIERQSGRSLDTLTGEIYQSLGLGLTYLPLKKYRTEEIAPTEFDLKFRKQLVQGYVHDPGSALMGGVAGHAGLFGNAKDLAVLMQMFLNKGQYGGVRYIDSNVVKDFTRSHFFPANRRGLCFDKPEPDPKKESPVTDLCSPDSYGHSGFTGTFTWIDPVNELVVVFLSNRVYPDAEENKLAKLGIRGKIHKAFYEIVNTAQPLKF